MCWNCGCMRPDDDHGNPDNITTETLRRAGLASGPSTIRQIMANMEDIYKDEIRGTPTDTAPIQ